jgi:hypothetical protein
MNATLPQLEFGQVAARERLKVAEEKLSLLLTNQVQSEEWLRWNQLFYSVL